MRLITPPIPACCRLCGCISWPGEQVYEGRMGIECVPCRERDWLASAPLPRASLPLPDQLKPQLHRSSMCASAE